MMETSKCPEYEVWGKAQVPNGIGGFAETPGRQFTVKGYLDLLAGDERTTNNAFIEESTHILITDYRDDIKRHKHWLINSSGERYDIKLVDDPVQLHDHLEIYLKFAGDK